jgi:NAD(P)-dependent dehydrogenase (short-subunit alcohol dehydrogenase family)
VSGAFILFSFSILLSSSSPLRLYPVLFLKKFVIDRLLAFGRFVYNASKAAGMMLSKCLALDLASKNVRVNIVAPGGFFDQASKQKKIKTSKPCSVNRSGIFSFFSFFSFFLLSFFFSSSWLVSMLFRA